jgi:hypothetical protein
MKKPPYFSAGSGNPGGVMGWPAVSLTAQVWLRSSRKARISGDSGFFQWDVLGICWTGFVGRTFQQFR